MHTAVIKLDNQGDFNCQLNCHPRPRLQLARDGTELLLTHSVSTPTYPLQHPANLSQVGWGRYA